MTDIDIPPTPATVGEAKQQANDLAYGFAKHVDDYWDVLYTKDPDYAWKRMLGWQAGADDAAKFGLWATPPSPWHGTPVEPPAPVPVPVPPPDVLLARLNELEEANARRQTQLLDVLALMLPKTYEASGKVPIFGNVSFTLKPQEPK